MRSAVCATFLALLCSIASPGVYARLTISGPDHPVIEVEDATMECFSDSDSDMANYTFEQYCKLTRTWIRLENNTFDENCFFFFSINRSGGRLVLRVHDMDSWIKGPYRCVRTDSRSGEEEVSAELTLNVIYLYDLFFPSISSQYREEADILWVESGSTVEVKCESRRASQPPMFEWSQEFSDWILPSDTLVLKHVGEESEGTYICQARHPALWSLVKTRSFQLRVKPRSPEAVQRLNFNTSNVLYVMSFVAIPAVMLLILVLTLFSILIRYRRKQMRKPQISLVDGDMRAPIYKGSLQFVHSTTSDRQPLVM
ncbi:uncharacterized protein LOC130293481 [Hyla sarda]|uniref:uncharacterized protein LOC130293481 n=1 Tax=Hyla sarda TaxID=327740 RepID=UPI0024C3024A|nr:uncharacterized protein LOC130293481 [Hyla sarda]